MNRSLRVAASSIGIATFAVAAVVSAAWLLVGGGDSEWQSVRARGAAIAVDALRGIRAHGPLRGEPVGGDATTHYVRATAEPDRAQRMLHEQRRPTAALDWSMLIEQRVLPPDIAEHLAPFDAALEALAAGAASDRIHFGPFWTQFDRDAEGEPIGRACDFVGFPVGRIALVAARHELARGRCEIALQRTADALALARDELQVGIPLYELIGAGTVAECCAAWSDEAVRLLAPPLLRELADVLRRFDEATPPAAPSERSACGILAEAAFHDPRRGEWWQVAARLFTAPEDRTLTPAELGAFFDAIDALPPATAPWSVREPALVAATTTLPQLAGLSPADVERARREAIARMRLLRMAIAHRLGEPVPSLPDPLGDGALQVEHDGTGVRFASRGQTDGEAIERRARKQ